MELEKEKSLHEMLGDATEEKTPSENKSFSWNLDYEDVEFEEEKKDESKYTNSAVQKNKDPKEIEKDCKASSETLTAAIDTVFDMAGSFYLNHRFKKNFSDEDWEKAKSLQYKNPEKLEGEDLILYNRFKKLNDKRERKMKELPFDESGTERLNRIFFNYYKTTGKQISPEIMLYMGLCVAVLEKANTVFFD